MNRLLVQKIIFIGIVLACLIGWISPSLALACGVALALTLGAPWSGFSHKATKYLLQASIVGLGFGMNLGEVWAAGKTGFGFTVATLAGTLALGWLLGRVMRIDAHTSCLVSSGTAICGGSAIAAVGAVLNADKKTMSVSLGIVFILNAIALFIFPPIGHWLGLTQHQFGLWAAIAIHDTSSVVGAAARYGDEALRIATTVKLTRALWIIPLTLVIALAIRRKGARVTIPWFIFLFVLAAAVRTGFPQGAAGYDAIRHAAKTGLTVTLFLIGTGMSLDAIKTVGARAMVQGILLWMVISLSGFAAVRCLK